MAEPARRRSNRERSEETREKLLEATIACLARSGYAATTTGEVSRLAGLSRGAHLYHFRTREDLIAAALDHLFDRRVGELRALAASVPAGPDRARAVVDYVWEFARSDAGAAWTELGVAARTNRPLRERLLARWDRLEEVVIATFEELFPLPPGLGEAARTAPFFTLSLLQGVAIDRGIVGERDTVDRVLESLRGLASLWAVDPSAMSPRSQET